MTPPGHPSHPVGSLSLPRPRLARSVALVTAATLCCATALATNALAGSAPTGRSAAGAAESGFSQPYAGATKYEKFAPRMAKRAGQINRPLGRKRADRIAAGLGLDPHRSFTPHQFRLFVSGRGNGGQTAPAELVDASVRILTNTWGRPMVSNVDGERTRSVLASYGLFVNTSGLLESPANTDAPTRQVNTVIEPGGYMATWCRNNGARRSLRMLYRSAYTPEVPFGFRAQAEAGVAQLVPNDRAGESTIVGMSMAPAIWVVNFALIYTLSPKKAAKMPAYWTPIPAAVADAVATSPTGQVPYSEYRSYFTR